MKSSVAPALDYFGDPALIFAEDPADVGYDDLDSLWKCYHFGLLAPYQSTLPKSSNPGNFLYHPESVGIYLFPRLLVDHLFSPENHEVRCYNH